MEDAEKLEKLTRGSPSENTRSDFYFSQILSEVESSDKLENVNSATPKKQASHILVGLGSVELTIIMYFFHTELQL